MFKSIETNWLLIAGLCVALQSCATPQPVSYTGLASSAQLTPNAQDRSGHIPYSYSSPVDWRNYNKIIISPITVYRGADHQFGSMSEIDKATLAAAMQSKFTQKLGTRFAVVSEPAANTLRLRLTLTGATANTPVLSTLSRFDIAGGLYNGVQTARGGEGTLTGAVIYAVELYDAKTNRLLKAFVTKQYPSPLNIPASMGSLAASEAGIDKGADALVAQLTGQR